MSYEPVLTGTVHPSPRVRVDFNTVPSGTATATVSRSVVNDPTVRDGADLYAAGGFTVTDYAVPLGVSVGYWAEFFNSAGASLGKSGSTSTVVYGDEGYAWFSNPYDPTAAVLVPLQDTFGGGKRTLDQQSYRVGFDTVSLMGTVGLLTDFDASCITESLDQADKLTAVLAAGLVLVRTTPRLRIPPCLYLVVPSFVETGNGSLDDVQFGGETIYWPLTGCYQVTPPTLSSGVFEGTWQDVIDNFATWADLIAAYPTWLDLLKNPPGV